ncbi:MAG: hypothetical protein H6838_08290 [Planctomycetes bacterium]|nr:hypothetical protein [Planctomycetota bacterium]
MKTVKFTLCLLLPIAAVTFACSRAGVAASADVADVEHGRYLVERVGMCQDCHSPRDEKGQYLADKWLQGSPLPFAPTVPMPWTPVSKPIAGLPTLAPKEAEHFLSTGELPGGRKVLPPMPEFRFSPQDARDIVAYLQHPVAPTAAKQ